MHDFLTVAAAAPLQIAGIIALGLPDAYYSSARRRLRRSGATPMMRDPGARPASSRSRPPGAYYVMADISHLGFDDDVTARATWWSRSASPPCPVRRSSPDPANGAHLLRFAFCKKLETLEAAGERLRSLA